MSTQPQHPTNDPPARGRGVARLGLLVFPAILWLLATLALGGDLGKWNDDHFCGQIDPVTG
jgi:hypothetical protein